MCLLQYNLLKSRLTTVNNWGSERRNKSPEQVLYVIPKIFSIKYFQGKKERAKKALALNIKFKKVLSNFKIILSTHLFSLNYCVFLQLLLILKLFVLNVILSTCLFSFSYVMLVHLAWTGPLASTRFACTGWDTYSALLALTVLMNTTQKYLFIWTKTK